MASNSPLFLSDIERITQKCVHHLHEEVEGEAYKHIVSLSPNRAEARWRTPPENFVRVDVDAAQNNFREAACGGLIRDSAGKWLGGFQQRLGFSFGSTAAELNAIKNGLIVCKDKGFTKVHLYSDSLEALHLIQIDCGQNHPLSEDIHMIRSIMLSNWELEIHHAYRENLICADILAKTAFRAINELTILQNPPAFCSDQMLVDLG